MSRLIFAFVAVILGLLSPASAMLHHGTSIAAFPAVSWIFPTLTPTGTSCGVGNNSCIIYVDNTSGQGNNTTCAAQSPPITQTPSAGTQCATVAKAASLLRTGKPDWILIKTGTTYTNDTFGSLSVSGLSQSQPMVFGNYGGGTTKPIIQVSAANSPCITQHAAGQADFIVIAGIDFYAFTRDPGNASFSLADATSTTLCFDWQANSTSSFTYLVFENIHASFFNTTWNIETDSGNEPGTTCVNSCALTMNGNLVTDAYPGNFNPHSQGGFFSGIANLTFTFNMFDQNGWSPAMVGPHTASMTCASPAVVTVTDSPFVFKNGSVVSFTGTPCTGFNTSTYYCAINVSGNTFNLTASNGTPCPDGTTTLNGTGTSSITGVKANDFGSQTFNRNVYTNSSPAVFQYNISSNSSAEGVQLRSGGGPGYNNVFFDDSQCWSVGDSITGAVTGSFSSNFCSDSVSISQGPSTPAPNARGDGMQVQGGKAGLTITNNILAHSASGSSANGGIVLGISPDTPTTTGVVATGNIVCWPSHTIVDNGIGDTITPNVTSTTTACTGLGLPDPTRSVETYDSIILGGAGTTVDFVTKMRTQSMATWNANYTAPAVNAWVFPGYGLTP